MSISLDDILEASNVTFDEAKTAFEAFSRGYKEWSEIQPGNDKSSSFGFWNFGKKNFLMKSFNLNEQF